MTLKIYSIHTGKTKQIITGADCFCINGNGDVEIHFKDKRKCTTWVLFDKNHEHLQVEE